MPKFSLLKTVIVKQNNLTFGLTIHLKKMGREFVRKNTIFKIQ
jgi:hypothetical protein